MAAKRSKPTKRPKARTRRVPSKKAQRKPKEGQVIRALRDTNLFNATDPVRTSKGTEVEIVQHYASLMLVRPLPGDRRFWLNWTINHSDWKVVH